MAETQQVGLSEPVKTAPYRIFLLHRLSLRSVRGAGRFFRPRRAPCCRTGYAESLAAGMSRGRDDVTLSDQPVLAQLLADRRRDLREALATRLDFADLRVQRVDHSRAAGLVKLRRDMGLAFESGNRSTRRE